MCQLSDNIKFCTCTAEEADDLPNYWLLHRYVGERDIQTLGLPMLPTSFRDNNFEQHQLLLEKRLNEPDAFDKPMKFKARDFMEIVINNHSSEAEERYTYAFEFKKGKWKSTKYDPFDLMNRYKEMKFGEVSEES